MILGFPWWQLLIALFVGCFVWGFAEAVAADAYAAIKRRFRS
jgi:hypothetical protein